MRNVARMVIYVKDTDIGTQMDLLQKTVELLKNTDVPSERVAADTGISITTLYAIRRGDNDPGYSKVARLYEYLSGKRISV